MENSITNDSVILKDSQPIILNGFYVGQKLVFLSSFLVG